MKRHSRIILASGSPRRKELLSGLGLEFTVDTKNDFEEVIVPGTAPEDVPAYMSKGKSHGFHRPLEDDEVLITSDTVVLIPGKPSEVLGKPHSREQAIEMLHKLSGREHKVITAVTIRTTESEETFSDESSVFFEELRDEEIEYYVDNFKPFDKAGGYAIQEWIGHVAISRIEGSFYTIVGFPVSRVYQKLRDLD